MLQSYVNSGLRGNGHVRLPTAPASGYVPGVQDVLATATPRAWIDVALADFDAVLDDHAHCEKKAAASALSFVASYPELDRLVQRCTKLAREELQHFRQVHTLILARGRSLGPDRGNPYAAALHRHMRTGVAPRRIDRLLVASLIEARSCERLGLLGDHLTDPTLAAFYASLAKAEAGHHQLFLDLACSYHPPHEVHARMAELASIEAVVLESLPLLPRIH